MAVGADTDLTWLHDAVVYLGAAVVIAPICLRIGTSPILGYLVAGVALGPHALGVVKEVEGARGLAELGVVLLMFTIGLELSFQRLRMMAKQVFGFGLAQLLLTACGVYLAGRTFGLGFEASLLVAGALSLSSTALVLRLLAERHALQSRLGRLVFSTLLFQDLAVAPMLAAAPLIAVADETEMPDLPALLTALGVALAALVGIVAFGRYVMRPFLTVVAGLQNREVFAAATLLTVLATALAGALAGLSMALGAFLAGMVLAGSGYRHQVEMEIVPFRGLLLGLFFMSIGALIDLGALAHLWRETLVATLALILFKTCVTAGLARLWGFAWPTALHAGLLLAQGGEFAFALAAIAMSGGLLTDMQAQVFLLATALSLGLTPGLDWLGRRLERRLDSRGLPGRAALAEATAAMDGHVAVFGYGEAGRGLARLLAEAGATHVAVDAAPACVAGAMAAGETVYFADATGGRALDAVGLGQMRLAVVSVGDGDSGASIVRALKVRRPDLPVYARAVDAESEAALTAAGADVVIRETSGSSLHLSGAVLRGLGRSADEAARVVDAFRERRLAGTAGR